MRERRPATVDVPVTEYESFEHFLTRKDVPRGRFVVPYEGVPVDFLYEPVEGATTTVVFFHGSTKREVQLPMFSGERIMREIPANRLAISDPSLTLDSSQELILSWFAGSSKQPELQRFIRSVIGAVLEREDNPHTIFFGGSGGGFASLEMARHFPGSLAFVMNPQTILESYHPHLVRDYLDLCWAGAVSLADVPNSVSYKLDQAYPKKLSHTIGYVQNTRDGHHIANHQMPFLEKVGDDRNVFMLMDAWGDPTKKGHVVPPSPLLQQMLHTLVVSEGNWRHCLVDLGFNHHTTPKIVGRTVRRANADLPEQLVKDTM